MYRCYIAKNRLNNCPCRFDYILAHKQQRIAAHGVTQQPFIGINFLTRDIFQLKFGHYRDVKVLLEEAMKSGLMPEAKSQRVLTDFTGDAYRLVLEQGFDSLAEYEKALGSELNQEAWQQWYARFKEHVVSSHREILKQIF